VEGYLEVFKNKEDFNKQQTREQELKKDQDMKKKKCLAVMEIDFW
jgi:hypothetical protein